MKKLLILLLASLLLSGCRPYSEPATEPTSETTAAPTAAPTTEPATETTAAPTAAPTTEAANPTVPVLSAELWKPRSRQLSWEEYFSQNQWFDWWTTDSWIIGDEDGAALFTLTPWGELVIASDTHSERYAVPHSRATLEKYGKPTYLGTNGRIACFANETQIVSIDLETGADTVLVTSEKLQDVYFLGGSVLYYIRYELGNPIICRFYVPESREDVIRSLEEPWHNIRLIRPNSSLGQIQWEGVHPKMAALVEAALKDPNSAYKTADNSLGVFSLWEDADVIPAPDSPALFRLLELIQTDTGIPAMCMGSFDCSTGEYTELPGKLEDGCCYGSTFPHDHYGEENAELPVPKPINSEPQSYPLEALPKNWDALIYYGSSRLVSHLGYYLTDKNTVVFLPDDGSQPEVVYTAQFGQLVDLNYGKIKGLGDTQWLCIMDGNTIVAIDTENQVYKALIRDDYLIGSTLWSWEDGKLFFELKHGMYYQGYLYDPETETLDPKRIL